MILKEAVGFITLCRAQIQFESFPKANKQSLPRYPIPCVRIARLAVDSKAQGNVYGKALLKEAFLKILYAP